VTVFDQALPARVTAATPDVHIGRLLATVLAAVFYALGWVAAKTVRVVVFAVSWSFTAVRLGWREGFAKPDLSAR
jgi:hypothetical protein